MSDISWIKLSTDLPDNKKIKRIRNLPDGDKVILFWVFLLARAGDSNQRGGLFLTETLPYQQDDLAADFGFTIEFVNFSLIALEKYGMISRFGEILFIKNWEKYQSVDGMEKVRIQNRERQAKFKLKQKKITLGNVTTNVNGNDEITLGNGTEIEIERDKERELDKEIEKEREENKDISLLFQSYFENFIALSKKNQGRRAMATQEFLKLSRFEQELAVTGSRNYLTWYLKSNVNDLFGQYSINAYDFLKNIIFKDFQTIPEIKTKEVKRYSGYI